MPPRSFRNDSFFLAIERSGVADEVMATAILYRLLHPCPLERIVGRRRAFHFCSQDFLVAGLSPMAGKFPREYLSINAR